MARIIWLTGVSASGKTTIGTKLKKILSQDGQSVELLDGDVVRDFFEGDLGYSRNERMLNVRRIAFAAQLLAKNGITVIVANIAPYYEVRDFIRRKLDNYIQIYLKVDIKDSIKRSPKGYYKKYQDGQLKNFIGLDDPYDIPRHPDLTIDTLNYSVEENIEQILEFLRSK